METQVVLKFKTKIDKYGIKRNLVKHGKKIEAEIWYPNKYTHGEFQISKNGCAFYRPTLESALEFVREGFESRANAFGGNFTYTVSIKMED